MSAQRKYQNIISEIPEKAGVKEYFMIGPENKKVVLLTLNDSGVYEQSYEETGILNAAVLGFQIDF